MENTAYHHGDLRTALLDAAEDALRGDPDCLLSMRSLAARIGVSATAPHAHFKTKSDLLAALSVRGFDRLRRTLLEVSQDTGDPHTILSKLAARYLEFGVDNVGLYRLMFTTGVDLDTNIELRQVSRASYDVLRTAVRHAFPGRPDDVINEHALNAWALVHGLASLLIEGRIAEDIVPDRSPAALAASAAALVVQTERSPR